MKLKQLLLRVLLGKSWEHYVLKHMSRGGGYCEGRGVTQGYLSKDINGIAYFASHLTRKLLKEKGFPNTIHAFTEKHVLLGTEVSELADAIKKGKGDQEEGEELADIVIRACNFLSCDEMWHMYGDVFHPEAYNDDGDIIQVMIPIHREATVVDRKYAILSEMMVVVEAIKDNASVIVVSKDRVSRVASMSGIVSQVYELIALCELYSEMFLPMNLQLYIEEKMRYNFNRPYQYNTCKEFNK